MGQKLKTAGDQWRFAEINLSSTHLREFKYPSRPALECLSKTKAELFEPCQCS